MRLKRPATVVFFILLQILFISQTYSKEDTENTLSIGERFHYETSLTWRGVIGDLFRKKPGKPSQFKNYIGVNTIDLPKPEYKGLTLEEAIEKRRSTREEIDYGNLSCQTWRCLHGRGRP